MKITKALSVSLPILMGLMVTATAEAKRFTNAYISFDLPESWNCVLEQTEWVCRPTAADQAQQAIIILTAKEVGPSDSLPQYESHLKAPRQIQSRTGQLITSEVLNVYVNKIAEQPWVDGFHKSSEVPNYLTRYLATTKEKIAVLITFSAHTLYYSKYANDFLKAISSLRVIAPKPGAGGAGGAGGGGMFGQGGGVGLFEGDAPPEEGSGEGGQGAFGEKTQMVLAVAAILAAVGIYLMLKKKKKKPTRR
jgi:LPXTG-motif cell wall-anchored protein